MSTFVVLTSSKSNEWYTPSDIIERARRVLGHIDLDPASCAIANVWIKANRYYTERDNGMLQSWRCTTLWLNPPYGIKSMKKGNWGAGAWLERVHESYQSGCISIGAVVLARGDSEGLKILTKNYLFVDCDRIHFLYPDETGTKAVNGDRPVPGTRIFYLGRFPDLFIDEYRDLGIILRAI